VAVADGPGDPVQDALDLDRVLLVDAGDRKGVGVILDEP
jgi:hypothetical protein